MNEDQVEALLKAFAEHTPFDADVLAQNEYILSETIKAFDLTRLHNVMHYKHAPWWKRLFMHKPNTGPYDFGLYEGLMAIKYGTPAVDIVSQYPEKKQ